MDSLKTAAIEIGGKQFVWGSRTYVMGIINLTEDSFSGDGLLSGLPGTEDFIRSALKQGRAFAAAGVDILDVGGESTRPGSVPTPMEQELERVVPVVKALASELDTIIVNDVWGFRADPNLAEVAARHHAPVILMHNRSSWVHAEIKDKLGGRYIGMAYENLVEDICHELMESVQLAKQAAIPDSHIILDPGIGFGKTVEQNLELLDRLGEIRALGYPVLLGPSRKSFIGFTLDLPPAERVEGTAAAVAIGIARGADLIRVHDIPAMVRVARMSDAIIRRS
jgi:dihydropteroate synthase